MTHGEFWQLLKDVRLATQGFGDRKSARIDLIFRKCNQKVGLEDERVNNPDKCVVYRRCESTLCASGRESSLNVCLLALVFTESSFHASLWRAWCG